ncbi:MAG: helix-turn-helix domain-containing protein [Vulcanimicrobiaceae bacterium]
MQKNDQLSQVAAALATARRRAGLNQQALGAKIGVDQSYISKIERAAVDPQTSSLIELARALDLELMLIPRQLVPAVQALQREVAPDPRRMPSKIDQDLLKLSRRARALIVRYPELHALSEIAAAADELRIARVDESSSASARPLIDTAQVIINRLRGYPNDRPPKEQSQKSTEAAHELAALIRALRDLRNEWGHREVSSAPLPAYRLEDADA